ncbi:ABC transporter permease [Alteromonas sp. ASW11-130]|uniref:ABC transporter permease n=1 Tax=Alteromonas sp. ASW11-130 TaxID=3015775 RepID=UPI0022427705|nr:ABC transporter permease [Alteromonas sp. ASW11-130]MCW8091696.1 ABC transporter permease [Alteromonas sp. ASW11-130]
MVSFSQQLKGWRTVVFALFLRELQSKFNDKFGLGWAVLEPAVFIFTLSFLRGMISGNDVHTIPTTIFMMIGLIFVQGFMRTVPAVAKSIKQNKPLYAFRQVMPMSAVITTSVLEFLIKTIVVIILLIGLYLFQQEFRLNDPLYLLALWVCLYFFSASIALLFGIATAFIAEVEKIQGVLLRPFFFISCAFFSLQDVPKEFWPYLTWNPIVHLVELARYACYSSYGNDGVSFGFALSCTIVFFFFSLAIYHITWKNVLSR